MEAAPGPAKGVTVGDEGAVNVRLRLSSRILSLIFDHEYIPLRTRYVKI